MSDFPITSEEILASARTLIIAGGYNGFSYADIAKKLGIRTVSIYHYFPSKVDLVRTLVQRYREAAERGTADLEQKIPDPAKLLQTYADHWSNCIEDGSICVCALLAPASPSLPPEVSAEVQAYFHFLSSWLTSVMARGAREGSLNLNDEPKVEAEAFMATAHGAMLSARARGTPAVFGIALAPTLRRLGTVSNDNFRQPGTIFIRRHSVVKRLTHWLNVLCLSFLLLSGLQIFNAHPELYWGHYGADGDPAVLTIGSDGRGEDMRGFVRVAGFEFRTTGVLGVSNFKGERTSRAFPAWATIPLVQDLAAGRRWHFFFAWIFLVNGIFYLGFGLLSGHFRCVLALTREQLSPRHLWHDVFDDAALHFPQGEETNRSYAFKKLTYLAVIVALLPTMVLTGLTMSPGMDAVFPALVDLFGGRQSARTIHFMTATVLVIFVIVHVAMVVLSGARNSMHSMIRTTSTRFSQAVTPSEKRGQDHEPEPANPPSLPDRQHALHQGLDIRWPERAEAKSRYRRRHSFSRNTDDGTMKRTSRRCQSLIDGFHQCPIG